MGFTKKILQFLLLLFGFLILVGCKKYDISTLNVGVHKIKGDFIPGWEEDDEYIWDLIHGYSTLIRTENGKYVWDTTTVLETRPQISTDFKGNKTYTFTLKQDLLWNNGEIIRAKDYIANLLIRASKEWGDIANVGLGDELLGFQKYRYGEVYGYDEEGNVLYDHKHTSINQKFSGVRLLSDFRFSLTINKDYLPYFFDETLVGLKPIYLPSYLPGFEVCDDGDGAYLTRTNGINKDIRLIFEESVLSKSGTRHFPKVTCGPYNIVSYEKNCLDLAINSYYKGNYQGKKPQIENIRIKEVNPQSDLEQVVAGTLHLICGVSNPNKIKIAGQTKNIKLSKYYQNEYYYLGMTNDYGPTMYPEVRRAIGFLIDREKIAKQNSGEVIDGPYSIDYWVYQESKDTISRKITNYSVMIENANLELDNSKYKYEADGTTLFDPVKASRDYIRHDEEKNPLIITQCTTGFSLLSIELQNNAWLAGIKYEVEEVDLDTFNKHYYQRHLSKEQKYNLFELSTSFEDYNPYLLYHSNNLKRSNYLAINDSSIDNYTLKMYQAENEGEFIDNFIALINHWNRNLPTLPLYTKNYYDIYNIHVKGIKTTAMWNWANDICDIYLE